MRPRILLYQLRPHLTPPPLPDFPPPLPPPPHPPPSFGQAVGWVREIEAPEWVKNQVVGTVETFPLVAGDQFFKFAIVVHPFDERSPWQQATRRPRRSRPAIGARFCSGKGLLPSVPDPLAKDADSIARLPANDSITGNIGKQYVLTRGDPNGSLRPVETVPEDLDHGFLGQQLVECRVQADNLTDRFGFGSLGTGADVDAQQYDRQER